MNERDTKELEMRRHICNVHNAKRDLQSEAAFIAKRFRKGIKQLEQHADQVESEIDENVMEGMATMEDMSPELKRLIADPTLDNTPTDDKV